MTEERSCRPKEGSGLSLQLLGRAISICVRLEPFGSFVSRDSAIENLFHLFGKRLEPADILMCQGEKPRLDGCALEYLDCSV